MAKKKVTEPGETFATRISYLMDRDGLSMRKLADMTRTSTTTINAYRLGTRTPGLIILVELAKCLNTNTDYLCALTDDDSPAAKLDRRDDVLCPVTKDQCLRGRCAWWNGISKRCGMTSRIEQPFE